jgi:hypothetical protein
MRAVSSITDAVANGGGGKLAVEESTDGKSAVDDGDWFAKMARALHPDKPGTILHLETGLGDERLCQRYAAAKDPVQPKAYFLRALLRGKGGWTYLAYLMDGSDAPWWLELQQAQRVFAALKQVK